MKNNKVKNKIKFQPLTAPTEGYGYPTLQRVNQSNGFTAPGNLSSPGYMDAPLRPTNAPPQSRAGALEANLDKHEQHILTRFLAAALTVNGRAKVSSYEEGGLSKGSKVEGELPFTDDEYHMVGWYNQVMKNLPHRTKCGLQLLYKIYLGENNGVTLDDIGRTMTREDDKKIIKGGYITFYRMAVQDIEDAERKIVHINAMRKVISNAVNAN